MSSRYDTTIILIIRGQVTSFELKTVPKVGFYKEKSKFQSQFYLLYSEHTWVGIGFLLQKNDEKLKFRYISETCVSIHKKNAQTQKVWKFVLLVKTRGGGLKYWKIGKIAITRLFFIQSSYNLDNFEFPRWYISDVDYKRTRDIIRVEIGT